MYNGIAHSWWYSSAHQDFFILKSAAQTSSPYSTSEISTMVGGCQTPFMDGKTEARSDGAQQQTTEPENSTRHSHGNSQFGAGWNRAAPCCEFCRLLQTTVEPWRWSEQAGLPYYPSNMQEKNMTQNEWTRMAKKVSTGSRVVWARSHFLCFSNSTIPVLQRWAQRLLHQLCHPSSLHRCPQTSRDVPLLPQLTKNNDHTALHSERENRCQS